MNVEYDVTTLGAFFHCALYGSVARLAYSPRKAGCKDCGKLFYVLRTRIKSCYEIGIIRVVHNMAVDPVLVVVTVGRLMKIDWIALKSQKRLPYNYAKEKVVLLPEKPPLVWRSTIGVKVREVVVQKLS